MLAKYLLLDVEIFTNKENLDSFKDSKTNDQDCIEYQKQIISKDKKYGASALSKLEKWLD